MPLGHFWCSKPTFFQLNSLNFVYDGCLLFPMSLYPPIFRKLEKNTQQFVTGQETREKEENLIYAVSSRS